MRMDADSIAHSLRSFIAGVSGTSKSRGSGLERTCRSRRCWDHSRTGFSRPSGPNNVRDGHSRVTAITEPSSEVRSGTATTAHPPEVPGIPTRTRVVPAWESVTASRRAWHPLAVKRCENQVGGAPFDPRNNALGGACLALFSPRKGAWQRTGRELKASGSEARP